MKKIMIIAVAGLMALATAAYAGNGHKQHESCSKQTCSPACTPDCKKDGCAKSCTGTDAACTKQNSSTKKS